MVSTSDYYQRNRERIIRNVTKYNMEHREEIKQRQHIYFKQYYLANKEKIIQRNRERYLNLSVKQHIKILDYAKQYRKTHKKVKTIRKTRIYRPKKEPPKTHVKGVLDKKPPEFNDDGYIVLPLS